MSRVRCEYQRRVYSCKRPRIPVSVFRIPVPCGSFWDFVSFCKNIQALRTTQFLELGSASTVDYLSKCLMKCDDAVQFQTMGPGILNNCNVASGWSAKSRTIPTSLSKRLAIPSPVRLLNWKRQNSPVFLVLERKHGPAKGL